MMTAMTIMKMSQLRSLTATACLSLVLLCHIEEVSSQPSALIYNQRDFADDVLRSLYTRDNECSSMLGLSMAFGLLYPSAVGESLTEMQQVFGFPPTESNLQLVWSDTQNSLEATLNGNCSRSEFQNEQVVCLDAEPLLEIANIVWVPRLNGLNETYKRVVGNLVEEMDFNDENTGSRVNRWVSDATNGLISRIVNDGPLLNVVLLAVNTIYLKAQWAKPFAPSDTNNDQFYTTASRTTPLASTAHFMHQVDFFDYSETALSGYQLLKMSFNQGNQGQLSMVFALPLSDEGGMIIPRTELLWDAMPQLERTRVALALPKFRFEARYGGILKRTLQNLGLRAPFSKGDLCIQNGSCNGPFISKVLQKTVINLNEEGVEAAAATAVFGAISLPTEQPVLFQADHPFYFFILDESAEVVIFEGRVGDPGIVADAPAPQLAASHQDSGFWMNNFPLLDPPRAPMSPNIFGPLAMQDRQAPTTDLTSNQRIFADDLVSRIYTNDNECSSALGISMVHSLLYPAAIGDSLTQMATTLLYPQTETNIQLLWSDTQTSIQATYDGACRGYEDAEETICMSSLPRVSISNAVFVPSQAGLNSTYEQVVGDFVFAIDFEADGAGSLVNDWVNASTNGLIDSIVDDGPLSPLVLLAINTIYLKASWAVPFSLSNTNEDAFYTSLARAEAASSTHFMHQVEYFDYSHAAIPDYQLLGLPFNDEGLSMYFALPMSSDVPVVTSTDLFSAIPRLNRTRVAIALPKFQFESEYEEILMESLKAMGMQAPFLGDLCIQSESCDVSISRVAQKTFIDVNEEGVEAAAVSSLLGTVSIPTETPVLFQADHPFQFFIYDETHRVVIFEGQVGDPGFVEGAAGPQLTSTHDDADFWSFFGVDPSIPSPPEVLEQPSFPTNTELITNHRAFADDLVPLIYTNDNECSSALGISMAHSLVYPSSIDESLTQMAITLGYPQSETNLQLLWSSTQNSIQQAYNGECISPSDEEEPICASIITISNAVFVPSQAGLNSTYKQVVGDFVMEIDFDADDAGSMVNEWVNVSTNGLIESIVEDGPLSPLVLLAVNTIYLKGSWMNPFSASATNEDTFYTSVARSEALADTTHFMHQVDYFDYSITAYPEYQLLKQPFNDDRLSVIYALPTGDAVSMMSSEDLFAALPQLNRTRVAMALPKFQFESEYEEILMESLKAMGMEAPFVGGLCIQVGSCDAYISLVIQKTFIDVNENGVEAAAASVVGVAKSSPRPTDPPVLFKADHPFQFFIYDDIEQVVIFEGQVGNPGIVDEAATPQLTARHADVDFWATNFGVELSDPSKPEGTDPSVSNATDLTSNQRAFADELVPLIYENDNECSSALGISMAHSLVYPAAIDQSLVDMMTTLRYPPSETNLQLLWSETQNRIEETYDGACNMYEDVENTICASSSPLVKIGNAVFVPSQSGLNSTYEQIVGDFVFAIDFEAEDAGSIVNDWVNTSTNGLIDSIVEEGPLSPLVLIAINTIYLKAAWAVPFAIYSTNEDTFYTSVERSQALASKTHFMHQVGYFDYSHTANPKYQLLRQPFSEKGLSMYFVLPTSSDAPMLASADLFDVLPQLNQSRVAIALPKFQFESEYETILIESLQDMGMVAPFLGGLCIQSESCDVSISRVAQKTFIDVNEEGVEAAAVTVVTGTTSVPTETPILFQADHPFQFFIYDEDEQVFIFEGRVGDPGMVDGAAAPQLNATHKDAGFWSNNFGVDPSTPPVVAPEVLEQPSGTDAPTPDDEGAPAAGKTDDSNTTDGQANGTDGQATSSAVDNINRFRSTLALLVASFLTGGYVLLA